MIEGSVNFEITREESKDIIIDLVIEICIKELNHMEESYVEIIQDLNISYRDLVG